MNILGLFHSKCNKEIAQIYIYKEQYNRVQNDLCILLCKIECIHIHMHEYIFEACYHDSY